MRTYQAIVSVSNLNGDQFNPDVNGNAPLGLFPFAGQVPANRTGKNGLATFFVLNGTVAQNSGIEVGKLAYVTFTEREASDYGTEFNVRCEAILPILDAIQAQKELGKGRMIDCVQEEGEEHHEGAGKFVEAKVK